MGVTPETLGSASIQKTTSGCLSGSEKFKGVAWGRAGETVQVEGMTSAKVLEQAEDGEQCG